MLVWYLKHCCSSGTLLEDRLMSKAPSSGVQDQQKPCWGAGRVIGSRHLFLPHLSTPCVVISLPLGCTGASFPWRLLGVALPCVTLLVRGGNHSRAEQEVIRGSVCLWCPPPMGEHLHLGRVRAFKLLAGLYLSCRLDSLCWRKPGRWGGFSCPSISQEAASH